MKKYVICIIISFIFDFAIFNFFNSTIFYYLTIIISLIFFLYWIILVLKYEKDPIYEQSKITISEDQLFKKYSPIIAGCIQGNREVQFRDIIATILDLVDKKYLKLEINKNENLNNYTYILSQNKESEYVPDEIEGYIIKWFFCDVRKTDLEWLPSSETSYAGLKLKEKNFLERLKEIIKENNMYEKLKKLNKLVMKKINSMGANKNLISQKTQRNNNYIFLFSVAILIFNILNFPTYNSSDLIFICLLPFFTIIILPISYLFVFKFIYIPISYTNTEGKKIRKKIKEITKNKFRFRSACIIIIIILISSISFMLTKSIFILSNELIIGIASLIILTDKVMLKNDYTVLEDYSALNLLKDKIEEYSLIEEKEVKEIILWEKYLIYAISFGIATKIKKQGQQSEDSNIYKQILNDSKMLTYLEHML